MCDNDMVLENGLLCKVDKKQNVNIYNNIYIYINTLWYLQFELDGSSVLISMQNTALVILNRTAQSINMTLISGFTIHCRTPLSVLIAAVRGPVLEFTA